MNQLMNLGNINGPFPGSHDNYCPCCGQRKNGMGVGVPYYQGAQCGEAVHSTFPITVGDGACGGQSIGGFAGFTLTGNAPSA